MVEENHQALVESNLHPTIIRFSHFTVSDLFLVDDPAEPEVVLDDLNEIPNHVFDLMEDHLWGA